MELFSLYGKERFLPFLTSADRIYVGERHEKEERQ